MAAVLKLGRDQFEANYKNKMPVVAEGVLGGLEKWKDSEYLATSLGTKPLNVFTSVDNCRFLNANGMVETISMLPQLIVKYVFNYPNVSEKQLQFIDDSCTDNVNGRLPGNQTAPQRIYLRTQSMPEALYRDIATPLNITSFTKVFTSNQDGTPPSSSEQSFAQKVFRQTHMQLWMGTKGNVTPLHYDRNHGLLAQIIGSKRIDLFSHADTPYLYPDKCIKHVSRINLRDIDSPRSGQETLKQFPDFEEATRYRVVLNPGELLYIPPFWWHDVTSLDNSLSVTFPWDLEGNEEIPPIMLL